MGWGWYPKPTKRRPADGIKAKTGSGKKFGQSWWAGKWVEALEQLVDPGRLSRGRSYARSGQVLNLDIKPGRVDARVQGSQPRPYNVRIDLAPLPDAAWTKVAAAMAAQALFAAKLLAGEMPPNIEEAFAKAGVSLFPRRAQDLETDCSCPRLGQSLQAHLRRLLSAWRTVRRGPVPALPLARPHQGPDHCRPARPARRARAGCGGHRAQAPLSRQAAGGRARSAALREP